MTALNRKDSYVKKDILDELKWTPQIDQTEIGVIVDSGAVTLTGHVPRYVDKEAAKSAAKRIKGVRAIADEIEVKLPSQMEGRDEEIAHRISEILKWNAQLPGDEIQANVRDGVVNLSGEVDWYYQKGYVKSLVENIKGVKAIFNSIKLKKKTTSKDVKHEIVKALHRHAAFEANKVNISVANGTVTLEGEVDAYSDINLIEDAAWSASGVSKVVDKLRIA
jgi:osmotically-inducible protein OsmY